MKAILLTIAVVSLFSACTTGEKMSGLEPGMTRQQVVGILGRTDAVRSNDPYEQLEYNDVFDKRRPHFKDCAKNISDD